MYLRLEPRGPVHTSIIGTKYGKIRYKNISSYIDRRGRGTAWKRPVRSGPACLAIQPPCLPTI
ncbi:hypothetical protein IBTHAUMO2_380026 [Nitrosopumilaceae archaeon]|nr:hypothetical protein IBTHAUMO2_380026 [Nitrosopumilaceae archaeon]